MKSTVAVVLLAVVASAGCSLEAPKPGKFKINIEDQDQTNALNLSDAFTDPYSVLTAPSATADFNCFTVNITGPGIQPDSERFRGCTSPDNMNQRGFGILSRPVPRGVPIEMDLPSGPGRNISVFGIYPSNAIPECNGGALPPPGSDGGGGQAFFLGDKTIDLAESASVTVPIAFTQRPASIFCQGGNLPLTIDNLFPYGGIAGTRITINGTGLGRATAVTVGGVPCVIAGFPGQNSVQCDVGAHAAAVVDIVVTDNTGMSVTLPNGYTYVSAGSSFFSIDTNPMLANFGGVAVGATYDRIFMLLNTGGTIGATAGSTVSPAPFSFTGGSFPGTGGSCAGTLSAGNSCTVQVRFAPVGTGAFSGTINIGGGAAVRTINGTGI